MPRLSIIIAVLGEPQQFEDTLVSVLENMPADCQVLAAFDRPYHDPYELEGEVQFVRATPRDGLAGMLNRALAACEAPWVHVVGCGVEARAGWVEAALPHFGDPHVGAVAPVLLQRQSPHRIHSAGISYTSGGAVRHEAAGRPVDRCRHWPQPLGPDQTAAFYRRSALAAVGGFSTEVGDPLVGVDLALRLARTGFGCALASDCRVLFDRSAERAGALKRGWHAERHFWRWAAAHGMTRSLAAHTLHLGAKLATALVRPSRFVEVIGHGLAMLTAPAQCRQGREWTCAAEADVARDEPAECDHAASRRVA